MVLSMSMADEELTGFLVTLYTPAPLYLFLNSLLQFCQLLKAGGVLSSGIQSSDQVGVPTFLLLLGERGIHIWWCSRFVYSWLCAHVSFLVGFGELYGILGIKPLLSTCKASVLLSLQPLEFQP